jgi:hypothetical protein
MYGAGLFEFIAVLLNISKIQGASKGTAKGKRLD